LLGPVLAPTVTKTSIIPKTSLTTTTITTVQVTAYVTTITVTPIFEQVFSTFEGCTYSGGPGYIVGGTMDFNISVQSCALACVGEFGTPISLMAKRV
jgi:hypothetical protein